MGSSFFQGIEVARRIRDEERGGKAKLVIIGTISHCIHFNQPASKLSRWGIEVTLKRHTPLGRWVKKGSLSFTPSLLPRCPPPPCDSAPCVVFFFLFTSYHINRPLRRRDSQPLGSINTNWQREMETELVRRLLLHH